MSFIPDDELKSRGSINLAPMIDFLFLMLIFFASLAISRITTLDTEVNLVQIRAEQSQSIVKPSSDLTLIHIGVSKDGNYKWISDMKDYHMVSAASIGSELQHQYDQGLLPQDKRKTLVLLRIDKEAQWASIIEVLFAVRDVGFEVRPIYMPEEEVSSTTQLDS